MKQIIPIILLLVLLLASCKGPVVDPGSKTNEVPNTVRLFPGNSRYLEYKGNPMILITSAEHYGAVVNLDFDYNVYLETLEQEGFNYTRIFTGTYIEPVENIFGIERNTLAPLPGRYISPWVKENGKYDLNRFNPEYFKRLGDFVTEADKRGVIVEITLFSSIYAESAWKRCPFNALNNLNDVGDMGFRQVNTLFNGGIQKYQEQFIRKVVTVLNEYDNIFYEIQNEPWSDNPNLVDYVNSENDTEYNRSWQKKVEVANGVATDWQEWVASTIIEEESKLLKKHLIAQNISNFTYSLDALPEGVSMVNFHYALPEAAIQNRGVGGVTGLDETGFMPQDDMLYINQAWRFILSGGGLYNNLDYSYTAGNEAGNWPIPESNPGWGGPGFRKKLSYLVNTMDRVPFHEMEVSDSVLKKTDTSMKKADTGMKQFGLQIPGELYLIFLENYQNSKLVPVVPPGDYLVAWLNVDTGERMEKKESLNKDTSITSPFKEEQVVLLIQKIE